MAQCLFACNTAALLVHKQEPACCVPLYNAAFIHLLKFIVMKIADINGSVAIRMYSIKELAALYGISRHTLVKWIAAIGVCKTVRSGFMPQDVLTIFRHYPPPCSIPMRELLSVAQPTP
jgi:hypothetical protein